jgi:hypothetical protein
MLRPVRRHGTHGEDTMSEKVITLNQATKDRRGREKQELTSNDRLRLLANLVQTILDAENIKPFSIHGKKIAR